MATKNIIKQVSFILKKPVVRNKSVLRVQAFRAYIFLITQTAKKGNHIRIQKITKANKKNKIFIGASKGIKSNNMNFYVRLTKTLFDIVKYMKTGDTLKITLSKEF